MNIGKCTVITLVAGKFLAYTKFDVPQVVHAKVNGIQRREDTTDQEKVLIDQTLLDIVT